MKQQQTCVTFDAGALIAIERQSGRIQALLGQTDTYGVSIKIPAGVLGQAWRGSPRQARLGRLLRSERVEVVELDELRARAAGVLCEQACTSDLIDASVVLCAREHGGGLVVTSDPADLKKLDPKLPLYEV